MSFIIVGF